MNHPQNENKEWERLKALAERLNFGELRVIVKNGKPVRAENITQQIKLDDDSDFNEKMRTISLL